MHTAKLSNISWRLLHVWRRNGEVLLTTWYTNFLPPLLEPVFYVLAFGFGIGGMIGDFTFQEHNMSYLQFVAPGVVAVAVMFWSFFETTYSSFVRMYYQRTFDAMIATPLLVEDVIAGELLWARKGPCKRLMIWASIGWNFSGGITRLRLTRQRSPR